MSVLAIIQARLGSTRLPRKALELIGFKPLIYWVVDRVKAVRGVDDVVLAVPPHDADVFRELHLLGVPVIAPDVDERDVLGRFAAVAAQYPRHHTIMRVTGDCPLFNPREAERVLEAYTSRPTCDYVWNVSSGYVDGEDVEVFSRTALLNAHWYASTPDQREHVTPWIRMHYHVVTVPPVEERPGLKTSVDTPEDLERVKGLLRAVWTGLS